MVAEVLLWGQKAEKEMRGVYPNLLEKSISRSIIRFLFFFVPRETLYMILNLLDMKEVIEKIKNIAKQILEVSQKYSSDSLGNIVGLSKTILARNYQDQNDAMSDLEELKGEFETLQHLRNAGFPLNILKGIEELEKILK